MKSFNYLISLALTACLLCTTACRKDDFGDKLPKIKSVTSFHSSGEINKAEFEYYSTKELKQIRQYSNGTLESYTDYAYSGGKLVGAKLFIGSSNSGESRLFQEMSFEYAQNRLSAIRMRDRLNDSRSKLTTNYIFDYRNGDIPFMTTFSSEGSHSVIDNSLPIDPLTGEETIKTNQPVDLTSGIEFDNKRNPFQGILYFGYVSLTIPGLLEDYHLYTFSPISYFHPNNIVKISDILPHFEPISNTFTYNEQGLPITGTQYFGIEDFKIESVYEYW